MHLEFESAKVSFNQKPYRSAIIETYGSEVITSRSDQTDLGRAILAKTPNSPGSSGIAISRAVELVVHLDDTNYVLSRVLDHVMSRQTVMDREALLKMEMAGVYLDIVVGCSGGRSNFAGITFSFIDANLRQGLSKRIILSSLPHTPL